MARKRRVLTPFGADASVVKNFSWKFFGPPRQSGSSHVIFKTPWPGDPRVNLQNSHGQAKPYQVRQALFAIDRLLATAPVPPIEQAP